MGINKWRGAFGTPVDSGKIGFVFGVTRVEKFCVAVGKVSEEVFGLARWFLIRTNGLLFSLCEGLIWIHFVLPLV